MKKRFLCAFLSFALLLSGVVLIPARASATAAPGSEHKIIEEKDTPLQLWYDESASHDIDGKFENAGDGLGSSANLIAANVNDDWERWSLPLGNGYFGVNVFGRTGSERLTVADKTLGTPYITPVAGSTLHGGLNTFTETYLDFGHPESDVTGYRRALDLSTALSTVRYEYQGVTYTREYFTSYPDRALIVRLDASEAGALSFTLRPTIPWEQEYMQIPGDRGGKTGTVTSKVENGIGMAELSGKMEYYDTDFCALYRVYTDGTGSVAASTVVNADGDTDGTIVVSGARSAYIVLTLDTDYELTSEAFLAADTNKPTVQRDYAYAYDKVSGYLAGIESKIAGKSFDDGYRALKESHLSDYQNLFGRVSLDLDFDEADLAKTTDELLADYQNGKESRYLEALYFQYGRYLLIASSRENSLPAHLQGAWNKYKQPLWSAGYWHNINVQMNYWPAFSTNLAETFEAYIKYNQAYMQAAENATTNIVRQNNPSVLGQDGGNGWSIATGAWPSKISGDRSAGNVGFTTELFWDYYRFTQNKTALNEIVYPVLANAARYITKCVKEDGEGHYLVDYCDSPEQYVNGVWYYTKGTTYAQTFAYLNNYNTLLAAKDAGIDLSDQSLLSTEEYSILNTVMQQIDKYDPIIVGLSGQIKEFREEAFYGDLGEYTHRHISQLVGLYPGNLITSETPAWLDAAMVTLTERGDKATGWGVAHRLALWARTGSGDRAYQLVRQLLKNNTATNLWDLHPPFQIDGNLGGTAGIAEMLLQSHESDIQPLAAIPAVWANGSYTGLCARGNFTVSAAWENRTIRTLNITSGSGNEARIRCEGIRTAQVTKADGGAVNYTVDGDLMTFATEAGETYILSGFTQVEKPEKVAGLSLSAKGTAPAKLSWTASSDAISYNVYKAAESEPTYTLIGSTTGASYSIRRTPSDVAKRTTYAVTAVNAQGFESDRALVYYTAEGLTADVNDVSASILANDLLQITVNATAGTGKYRVYQQIDGEWKLQTESEYPIVNLPDYQAGAVYGVSAVGAYDGVESGILKITSYTSASEETGYDPSNILKNKTFVPTTDEAAGWIHMADYGYQTLTDGSFDNKTGRFSTKTANAAIFDGTVDLGGSYLLSELLIYDFNAWWSSCNNAGADMKIELYADGAWTTAFEGDNAAILTHRVKRSDVNCLSFDLGLAAAEKIRISSTKPVPGNSISLYEIECSGVLIPGTAANISYEEDRDNIFAELAFVPGNAVAASDIHAANYGYQTLTDGVNFTVSSGRFSTKTNATATFDALMNLNGSYRLDTLRIYDYIGADNNCEYIGNLLRIDVREGGVWKTVYEGDNAETLTHRVKGQKYLAFELGVAAATGVRIISGQPMKITDQRSISIYEIECSGAKIAGSDIRYRESDNLFEGKTFTMGSAATPVSSSAYATYAGLTDGVFANMQNGSEQTSGAWARYMQTNATDFCLDALMDFEGKVILNDLKLYDVNTWTNWGNSAGKNFSIRVYNDGVWTEVCQVTMTGGAGNNLASTYRYPKNTRDAVKNQWLQFSLGGVEAERLEIVIDGNGGDNRIAYYEFECTGYEISGANAGGENRINVFEGRSFTRGENASKADGGTAQSYAALTDGVYAYMENGKQNTSGHFDIRVQSTGADSCLDAVMDFGGPQKLYTLRLYDYGTSDNASMASGTTLIVRLYRNNAWTEAIHLSLTGGADGTIKLYRQVKGQTDPIKNQWLAFDLGGAIAEKIEIIAKDPAVDSAGNSRIIYYEFECDGVSLTNEDPASNVFSGLTADQIAVSTSVNPNFPAINAFDGDLNTRYAVSDTEANARSGYTVTVDLGRTVPLYHLSIYDWRNGAEKVNGVATTRSNETSVEVYANGSWIRLVNAQPLIATDDHTSFYLYGVPASKVRITFKNTQDLDESPYVGKYACATIKEIVCTTAMSSSLDKTALLDAYRAVEALENLPRKQDRTTLHDDLLVFRDLISDTRASEASVEAAILTLRNYLEENTASAADLSIQAAEISRTHGEDLIFTVTAEGSFAEGATVEFLFESGAKIVVPAAEKMQFRLAEAEYADFADVRLIADAESGYVTVSFAEAYDRAQLVHDLVHRDGKDATCTEPGYKPYDTCTRCDYSTYETIPAKGHEYGAWIEEIPATYESEGVLGHYHCSVCEKDFDAEKQELSSLVIPKLEAVVRLSGVKQNITLTTELRTNIFFPQGEKRVTKVLCGGVELPLLQRTMDGAVYDYVTISVAAKDAAKEIALTVSFSFEGESYEQTLKANLPQYANLLAKHEEGKYSALANAILYYVKCADSSAAFEAVREEAQKAAAVNSIDASSPIKGASIYLGSSPVWVISLDTGYTGKIRYSFAGRTYQKDVAKQESLALDEIRLSDLTETISFSYTDAGGAFVEAGSYNLSAYAEAISENETVAALVDALYDYSVAARKYIYGA